MKTLNVKDVKEIMDYISSYCDGFQDRKPMMFWFHSNTDLDAVKAEVNNNRSYATMSGHPFKQGNTYMILNGEQVKIADHPEVFEKFVFPSSYSDRITLFVYHRYLMQLEKEQLEYCLDVVNIGKKPVICLMNDYAIQYDKPSAELMSFINEHFDQYDIVID